MNRRELIMGAGAAGVAASLLDMPALAYRSPIAGIICHPRITYGPDAALDPHAEMMARQFLSLIDDKVIYAKSEFGYEIALTDPSFHISSGKPVFNWITGYTDEISVQGAIRERGVHLGTVGVGTSKGYDAYHGYPPSQPLPDYHVRPLWITFDEMEVIEPQLPKGSVGLDMRWVELTRKREKEET